MPKTRGEAKLRHKQEEKNDTAAQNGRRRARRREAPAPREVEHAPLPNIKFKDNAPLLVTILGNDGLVQELSGTKSQGLTFRLKNRAVSLRVATDFTSYIDFSKTSDLVIFSNLCTETFEFLSLMNAHGFTKFCFFTHLSPSEVKKRVWKEVSVNAHVFKDIKQLTRYICQMKVRPLELKSKNPFVFVERIEGDSLCGYVRGGPMDGKHVYIPGIGCCKVLEIKRAPDPLCKRNAFEPEVVDVPSEDEVCAEDEGRCSAESVSAEGTGECSDCYSTECSSTSEIDVCAQEKEQGLTREELERKYENKKRKALDAIKMQRLMFEREAENCRSEFIPGTYVRIRVSHGIDELRSEFRDRGYLIVGTVAEGEKTHVRGRIKVHKWAERTIRSLVPVTISLGWYRFQCVPVLSVNDGRRNRYLKRNLDGYCNITFFGPPECSGRFCLVKKEGFRILALGSIEGGGEQIVKKCKLIGITTRVFRNSVFVRQMFNTRDEVLRFTGGRLKSVSGLRGIIKKPQGYSGDFRASFEGSLNKDDVVFLKCYFPTDVPSMYADYHDKKEDMVYKVDTEDGEMKESSRHGLSLLRTAEAERQREKGEKATSESELDEEKPTNTKKQKGFSLPVWVESKLPLDMREVVEKEIYIPTAPEESEFIKLKNQVSQFRDRQALAEEQARRSKALKKEEARKQKEAGRCKSIIKTVVDMKKKHKKKKARR